jgi:hypothetical protein
MLSNNKNLISRIGATGQRGGGVVGALDARRVALCPPGGSRPVALPHCAPSHLGPSDPQLAIQLCVTRRGDEVRLAGMAFAIKGTGPWDRSAKASYSQT